MREGLEREVSESTGCGTRAAGRALGAGLVGEWEARQGERGAISGRFWGTAGRRSRAQRGPRRRAAAVRLQGRSSFQPPPRPCLPPIFPATVPTMCTACRCGRCVAAGEARQTGHAKLQLLFRRQNCLHDPCQQPGLVVCLPSPTGVHCSHMSGQALAKADQRGPECGGQPGGACTTHAAAAAGPQLQQRPPSTPRGAAGPACRRWRSEQSGWGSAPCAAGPRW